MCDIINLPINIDWHAFRIHHFCTPTLMVNNYSLEQYVYLLIKGQKFT